MKQVVILVRRATLNSSATAEALRVALGMTLADHRVTVLYIEDGAGAAGELEPEQVGGAPIGESLSLFEACHVREVVDAQSLKRALVKAVRHGVEVIDRSAAFSLVGNADAVLSF